MHLFVINKASAQESESSQEADYDYEGEHPGYIQRGLPLIYYYEYEPESQFEILNISPFYWDINWHDEGKGLNFFLPLYLYRTQNENYNFYSYLFYCSWDNENQDFFTLFPLGYFEKKHGGTAGLFLLYYWNNIGNNRDIVIFPFFWNLRTGDETTRFFLPLIPVYQQDDPFILTIIPLFYIRSVHESKEFSVLTPFQWYSQNKIGKSQGHVLYLFWWNNTSRQRAYGLFPIFFHKKYPDSDILTVFPLGYVLRSLEKGFHSGMVFPVIWHDDLVSVFPLYWQTERVNVLFPIYWQNENNLLIMPFYYRYRDTGKTQYWTALDIFFPFVLSYRTEESFLNSYMILFWHGKGEDWSFLYMLPLFGYDSQKDTGYLKVSVFSLYFYSVFDYERNPSEKETTFSFLFPLFNLKLREAGRSIATLLYFPYYQSWNTEKNQFFMSIFYPIFVHDRDITKTKSWFLGLIYTYVSDHVVDKTNLTVLFPIFWYTREQQDYEWMILYRLIYYINRPSDEYKSYGVAPFYFYQEDSHEIVKTFGLFFFQSRLDKETGEKEYDSVFNYLFPIHYYNSDYISSYRTILWPVFAWERWESGRMRWRLMPIYYYNHNPNSDFTSHHFLFPIFSYIREGEYRKIALRPIFRYVRDGDDISILGIPFYYSKDNYGSFGTVALIYWWKIDEQPYSVSRHMFVPIISVYRNSSTNELRIFTPLFYLNKDENDNYKGHVLYLYSWNNQSEKSWQMLLPLFFFWHNNKNCSLFVSPLFSRAVKPDSSTWVVLNAFWKKETDFSLNGIFPLYAYYNLNERKTFISLINYVNINRADFSRGHILYLYWWNYQHENKHSLLFPLYYFHRNESGTGFYSLLSSYSNTTEYLFMHILTYFQYSDYDTEDFYSFLFPVHYYHSNENNSEMTSWSPVHYFSRDNSKNTSGHIGYISFWSYKSDPRYFAVLPLFSFVKYEDGDNFFVSPLLVLGKDYDKNQSYGHIFYLFYWNYSKDFRRTTVLPLIHHRRDFRLNESLTVYPLGYVRSRENQNSGMIGPFFWNFDSEHSNFVLLPVYWQFKDNEEMHILTPLFYHYTDYNADITLNVIPWVLFVSYKDGEDGFFIATPLCFGWENEYRAVAFYGIFLSRTYFKRSGEVDWGILGF